MNLAELYGLNYESIATWSGYLDTEVARSSSGLAGLALRLFVELDPVAQREALEYLERLRNAAVHGSRDLGGEPTG